MQVGNASSFVAHLHVSSRIELTNQQQMHSVELHKQCPIIVILHHSKRGKMVNTEIPGASSPAVTISEGFLST